MFYMSKIRIHNMMFYGFHGIYEYEREQGQKFYIDVEMVTRDEKAAVTDDPRMAWIQLWSTTRSRMSLRISASCCCRLWPCMSIGSF